MKAEENNDAGENGKYHNRLVFPITEDCDRQTQRETSYMIMDKDDPIAWFQVNREYDGRITLLNAESIPGSDLDGHVLKTILDCVEEMAWAEGCEDVVLYTPRKDLKEKIIALGYKYGLCESSDPIKPISDTPQNRL